MAYLVGFDILGTGTHAIRLTTPLPPLMRPVIINGTTQPGYTNQPVIELDGTGAGPNATGLNISTGNSGVLGLSIHSFSDSGIKLRGGTNNLIAADFIGTDATGTTALGNRAGISIQDGSTANTIGGTSPAFRNLISANQTGIALLRSASGNLIQGNLIGTDPMGTTLDPNTDGITLSTGATANTIGGAAPGAGNLIDASRHDAILITDAGTTGNQVLGNTIGTDPTGTVGLGNFRGVEIQDASGNTVGGSGAAARNLISANQAEGVLIEGAATGNVVAANYLGTTLDGSAPLPNQVGVSVQGASGNLIGGFASTTRNVISGNSEQGVLLAGGATANVVAGNYIGTDPAGAVALSNGIGVYLLGAPGNTVGGSAPGAGNLISGNAIFGVGVVSAEATGNVVAGNTIGADASGTVAVPNGVGVAVLQTAAGNTIGGTDAGAGNFIAGNAGSGVLIANGATGNVVQGNAIGTDSTGTVVLGNGANGVAIMSASGNLIGGADPGAPNIIAFNGNDGVLVDTGAGATIQENSLFSNGNLGIELNNGGNNLQAFPELASAVTDGQTVTIVGTLNSTPDTDFTLEFFGNDVCNPSGFGEGQTFLGAISVTTDDFGVATFVATLSGTLASGQFVSATATHANGDTSAFAQCVQATDAGAPGAPGLGVGNQNLSVRATAAPFAGSNSPETTAHAVDLLFLRENWNLAFSDSGKSLTPVGEGQDGILASSTADPLTDPALGAF